MRNSTRVFDYEHHETGSQIGLVGIAHLSSTAYFKQVDGVLAQYEAQGAVILYENTDVITDEQAHMLSRRVKTDTKALKLLLDVVEDVSCAEESVVPQWQHLRFPETWQNVDVSLAEIAARLRYRDRVFIRLGRRMLQDDIVLGDDGLISRLPKGDELMEKYIDKSMASLDRVVVDYRNTYVLDRLDEKLELDPSQKFALLWGDDHLPGLANGLEIRGYTRANEGTIALG